MTWGGVAMGVGSVIAGGMSMSSGSKASKEASKDAAIQRNLAGQSYTPINVFGPGGMGISFGGGTTGGFSGTGGSMTGGGTGDISQIGDGTRGQLVYSGSKGTFYSDGFGGRMTEEGLEVVPGTRGKVKRSNIGEANISAGELEPLRAALVGGAGDQLGLAQGISAQDPFAQQAFANFLNAGQQGMPQMMAGAGQMFGNALGQAQGVYNNPFAEGLSQSLLGQAEGAFGALPGTQAAARDQQLALLREQARPEEERMTAGHFDKLHAMGQLGTTGGGIQTEAFARGLGQADLARQIQAGQEGRAAQQAQLGLGQGLLGSSSGIQSLQDALLTGATGRFGQMANLSSGLQGQQFGQALTTMQNIFAPHTLAQQAQGGYLQNMTGMLGGQSAINEQALAYANLAKGLMADQANTRMGQAAISMPVNNSASTAWAQLAQGLAPEGGVGAAFGSGLNALFGGGATGGGGGFSTGGTSGEVLQALNDPMFG